MSSPSLGAISGGIRYQVRFFWRHALSMLVPEPRVAKVVLESHGAGAVDDVVVYYTAPGVNERGSVVTVDFHQLKFHVAKTGAVDHDAVIEPKWTGTKEPMLKRLASAWATLHGTHPAGRLSLVTNWPWDRSSPIAGLLRDGGQLRADFLTLGPRSDVGKIGSSPVAPRPINGRSTRRQGSAIGPNRKIEGLRNSRKLGRAQRQRNCDAGSTPAAAKRGQLQPHWSTSRAARRVGDILKHVSADRTVQSRFCFFT